MSENNVLHAARWKYTTQNIAILAPSHDFIFATEAYINNRKKNLLNIGTSSTCPHNMVNFGLLTAEICWRVWAPLQIWTGFASWQRYCTAL